MVNVTNGPGISDEPAVAYLPGFGTSSSSSSSDSAQYIYASPAGVINDVIAFPPTFSGSVRLAVTLAAGSAAWTGLTAGADGQEVILWNSDPDNTLTLVVQNIGSLSVNQFQGSAGAYTLTPGNALSLIYFGETINAWVIIP
jgi:hypothetical protein